MSQVEILSPARCLVDHDFQDFLVTNRVITRAKINPEDIAFLPFREGYKQPLKLQAFLHLLEDNTGFIVPNQEIATNLYGSSGQREENRVRHQGNRLKGYLTNGEAIFHGRGIGWAVGVERFNLERNTIPLMYLLWSRMLLNGGNVNIVDLATAGWGIDDNGIRILALNEMNSLKNIQLKGTNVQILYTGFLTMPSAEAGAINYKLIRKPKKEKKEAPNIEKHLPPYLDFDFQDFLANEDVGLLQRVAGSPKGRLRLKAGVNVTPETRELKNELATKWGYLIPWEYISDFVYGDPGRFTAIIQRLYWLRDRLGNHQHLSIIHSLGVAVGVETRLFRRHMMILHDLWENMGSFVHRSGFSYSKYTEAIKEIKDLLKESPYQIVKEDGGYSLQKAA